MMGEVSSRDRTSAPVQHQRRRHAVQSTADWSDASFDQHGGGQVGELERFNESQEGIERQFAHDVRLKDIDGPRQPVKLQFNQK